jgi:hypothetical protein
MVEGRLGTNGPGEYLSVPNVGSWEELPLVGLARDATHKEHRPGLD